MTRQAYYPTRTADQVSWLGNFFNKLIIHATTLGITNTERDATVADARWVIYVLGAWLPAVRAWQKACTDAAEAAQSGGAGLLALPVFTAPPLPPADVPNNLPAVVPRDEGALVRIFDLVQELKENDACGDAMCSDLGIIGPEQTPPDLASIAPVLKAKVVGSHVELDWGWQGFSAFLDQCEIEVDRGVGYGLLTIDTTPGYIDTAAHPATATRWKYRAIYRVNDARVGQWSAEVSVTVG